MSPYAQIYFVLFVDSLKQEHYIKQLVEADIFCSVSYLHVCVPVYEETAK